MSRFAVATLPNDPPPLIAPLVLQRQWARYYHKMSAGITAGIMFHPGAVARRRPPQLFPRMFTGLIEEVGRVLWIRATERGTQLQLVAPLIFSAELRKGDSLSVNGSCLTIKTIRDSHLTFDLLEETLGRTNLRTLRRDSSVNLERALPADGRLGGHFVQGHIDCAVRVLSFQESGADFRLEVELPDDFAHYAAYKGSVALNGVSLTIAQLLPASFAVWIIPHTRRKTNFKTLKVGQLVNVEFDIVAKYIERMLPRMIVEQEE
jgi:riboflavin synthase